MLRITHQATGCHIDVPIAWPLLVGFNLQVPMDKAFEPTSTFGVKLGSLLEDALLLAMNPEFRPPSQVEIDHALVLAASRGKTVPEAAMTLTWFMRDFLAEMDQ